MNNFKDQLREQISRKKEIDDLPDGERYTAKQRWMVDCIELLLQYTLEDDRRQP